MEQLMGEFNFSLPSNRSALGRRLGAQLRSYQASRKQESEPLPVLREVLPLMEIPEATNLSKSLKLKHNDRWLALVFVTDKARYYGRCIFDRSSEERPWRVTWIGEAWLAKAVDQGLSHLERLESEFEGKSIVWLISSRRYRFSAFWIEKTDKFLIVSYKANGLELGSLVDRETLRLSLIKTEGVEGWQTASRDQQRSRKVTPPDSPPAPLPP